MSEKKTPPDAQEDRFNFDKSNFAVDALIIGARLQAKLSGKTPREMLLKQRAKIVRKKQADMNNWLKWIEIALENLDDENIK